MPTRPHDADAEFGPGGYLPERAAKRARKIVLREQMGLQWPVAAGVAALLVLVAGGIFLVTGIGPPGAPFAAVLEIEQVDPRGAEVLPAGEVRGTDLAPPAADLAVVRAGGGVRVFVVPTPDVAFCEASGRLESPAGAVWNANGRLLGGPGASLTPVPAQVFDGVLYVDAASRGTPPPAEDVGATPACSD
jgi:hypothetical protein